jgi:hypothetical protein
MSYSLNIEFKEQYLHAIVSGENTLANSLSYLDEIYNACIQYRCSNVLIEEHLAGPSLDTFDTFVVVTKNMSRAKTIGVRLAFLDMNTEHSKRELKFGENLAHIRGMNVRLFFDNTQEAVDWLLNDNLKPK